MYVTFWSIQADWLVNAFGADEGNIFFSAKKSDKI
jgi:hypothetical protein